MVKILCRTCDENLRKWTRKKQECELWHFNDMEKAGKSSRPGVGQLVWLGSYWEGRVKRRAVLLMEIEATLERFKFSLNTNSYFDKSEEISDLKIFPESYCGQLKTMWRATRGLWLANCPPLM